MGGYPLRLLSATLALVALAGCSGSSVVEIRIDDLSDWHGHLDPRPGGVGGASQLATAFREDRMAFATLVVAGGDTFGATPPLSALLGNEPAAKALPLMGINAEVLGNHDFDAGTNQLERLIATSGVPFLSANLVDPTGELPSVRPWIIRDVGGVRVGIIGLTNPEAPSIVLAGRMGNVTISDPVEAAHASLPEIRRQGAELVIVVAHIGMRDPNGTGPLADLARRLSGIDAVFGDHTNVQFSGLINGIPIIEARSYGVEYARVTIRFDRSAGRVLGTTTEFVPVVGFTPDPAVEAMLAPYREQVQPRLDEVLAQGDAPLARGMSGPPRSPAGDFMADAARAAGKAQMAFLNTGGVRDGLPSTYIPADPTLRRASAPFDLVAGDAYTVMPFDNTVVTGTLTGSQVLDVLEDFLRDGLPIVSGIHVTYDPSRPAGSRVVSATLDQGFPCVPDCTTAPPAGAPILRDERTYEVASSDYLALGGDGRTSLATLTVGHGQLVDALISHMENVGRVIPSGDVRVRPLS